MSEKYSDFLKSSIWKTIDFSTTEQSRGIKTLPAEKLCNPKDRRIDLVKPGDWELIFEVNVEAAIVQRKSRKSYTTDTIKLEELSFLLKKEQRTVHCSFTPVASGKYSANLYCGIDQEKR
jgi:hypothetical protein